MSVPTGAVVTDFDHHSPAFAQRPFEVLDELRRRAPVAWSGAHDGFWVVTGHQEVVAGLADYGTFSSASGPAIPAGPFGTRHIPVSIDPPDHRLYRAALNDWFSKEAIARREPELRALVAGIVQEMADRGSWDFVDDLANVSPGAVTLGILGWDPAQRLELLEVMSRGLRNQASTDPVVIAANAEGNRWIREQIMDVATARRAHPREDLMTVLATQPVVGGRPLTDEEVADTVVFLLLAGFHTTSGALASLLVHAERNPDVRARLDADRDLIPPAIEEIVRIYSPVTSLARKATTDTELGGMQVRTGDWVLFVNMGANHDGSAFDRPDDVDVERRRTTSVAFGWGVHRCLGLHLARTILRLEVEEVFDRLPGYRIDLDKVVRSDHMGVGYFYLAVPAHLPGR